MLIYWSLLWWASWAWHEIRILLNVIVFHGKHLQIFYCLWLGSIVARGSSHGLGAKCGDFSFQSSNLLFLGHTLVITAYKIEVSNCSQMLSNGLHMVFGRFTLVN